jgi:phage/plasmid-like protein (TIGR03299 family)
MTTETLDWLNRNVLVGFADKRGTAWHHRASAQGAEPNHYPAAIPVDDVRRRLFHWQAQEVPVYAHIVNNDDLTQEARVLIPNRIAIVRDDTYEVLGVPSASYALHQYDAALLDVVADILDDDLHIGSAGLLKGGAVAWVQVEMADNWNVGDVEFRPNLLATTSFNGEIATTYKRTCTIVVCDNTRSRALGENGQEYRVRHTAHSRLRLASARDALRVIHDDGAAFAKEVEQLLARRVDDQQFDAFLGAWIPTGDNADDSAATRARNERWAHRDLWRNDVRVAPWRGTAFGVIQAVNTYRQHVKTTRGSTPRIERTMMNTLKGVEAAHDRRALDLLLAVTS